MLLNKLSASKIMKKTRRRLQREDTPQIFNSGQITNQIFALPYSILFSECGEAFPPLTPHFPLTLHPKPRVFHDTLVT